MEVDNRNFYREVDLSTLRPRVWYHSPTWFGPYGSLWHLEYRYKRSSRFSTGPAEVDYELTLKVILENCDSDQLQCRWDVEVLGNDGAQKAEFRSENTTWFVFDFRRNLLRLVLGKIRFSCEEDSGWLDLRFSLTASRDVRRGRRDKLVSRSGGHLTSAIKELRNKTNSADVQLKAGDELIPAHKAILLAQSSVFEAMFQAKYVEGGENAVIEITDITAPVLKRFLDMLYGQGCLYDDQDQLVEILYAADKYQVADVKKACEKELICLLNSTNLTDLYQIASIYNAATLRNDCIEFLAHNEDSVFIEGKEKWQEFGRTNGTLVAELVASVAEYKQQAGYAQDGSRNSDDEPDMDESQVIDRDHNYADSPRSSRRSFRSESPYYS